MKHQWIRRLFVIAGIYDVILGMVFLLVPSKVFAFYGETPPDPMLYVQFPAALLLVFAVMFFMIAIDPIKNSNQILYGCGLKVSYCAIAFGYSLTSGISPMWMPWAWLDLIFLLLFILAWRSLASQKQHV